MNVGSSSIVVENNYVKLIVVRDVTSVCDYRRCVVGVLRTTCCVLVRTDMLF